MAKASRKAQSRQVAKLTKKQLGFKIGQNILSQLSDFANGIRQILEKGTDPATKKPLHCAPDDIKRSFSIEQLTAVEDFYTTFAVSPDEPEVPAAVNPK